MILDNFENLNIYKELNLILKKLKLNDSSIFLDKKDGKYLLKLENDKQIYYLVQHYKTLPKEQCILEAHKKYIDVHLVLSGEELIGHQIISKNLKITKPYDSNTDSIVYDPGHIESYIHLTKNTFVVFFPQDAHQPKIKKKNAKKENVFKVVIKIPIDVFNSNK